MILNRQKDQSSANKSGSVKNIAGLIPYAHIASLGQIGQSCLPFFADTWDSSFDYSVYITRGCFNLNTLMFYWYLRELGKLPESDKKNRAESELRSKQEQTFMTQSALLSYIEELNDCYDRSGSFPQILIADELVIYGRQISTYQRQLEKALVRMRAEQSSQSRHSEWIIRNDLNEKILIRPCAQGEDLPLEKNLRSQMKEPWLSLSLTEQREYVQEISNMITKSCEVENTSYAPFFRITEAEYNKLCESLEKGGWHNSEWMYHQLYAHIWQKPAFDGETNIRFLWTFRVHFDCNENGEKTGSVRIIPLAVFRSLSYTAVAEVCASVANCMETFMPESSDLFRRHIIPSLRNSCLVIRHIQVQLLSFLLSVISFFEETRRAGINFSIRDGKPDFSDPLEKNHDLDKIAQNFGRKKDVYDALCALCAEKNSVCREKLKDILLSFLNQNLPPLVHKAWKPKKGVKNPDCYLRRAEDISYRQEMRDAVRLSQMQREGAVYNTQVKTDIFLEMDVYLNLLLQSSKETDTLEGCMGAVFMLMDQGMLSMVVCHSHDSVCNHLRSGEQSMSVKARRLYRFIPALIELESRSRRRGFSPRRQIIRFGRFLDEKEPGQNLEEQFRDISADLEKCGERFDDWNINLLRDMDFPRMDKGIRATPEWYQGEWESEVREFSNAEDYFHYERGKQYYYKSLASDFRLM